MTDLTARQSTAGLTEGAHQIVAMFETYDDARAAREALIAAGIDRSRIELVDRSAGAEDTSFSYERTDEGLWGAIKRLFMPDEDTHIYAEGVRRGHAMLIVQSGDEQDRVVTLLESHGAIDVDAKAAEWRQGGWSGTHEGYAAWQGPRATSTREGTLAGTSGTMAGAAATGTTGVGQEEAIPVYQEELRIGKRQVGRGSVRVRSYVIEEPVHEEVNLREERIELERRPVDRAVSAADRGAEPFRERTIEVTATAEEAVISKDARVKEEIVVRKEADERTQTVSDSVRRTEVEVEDNRTSATGPAANRPKP